MASRRSQGLSALPRVVPGFSMAMGGSYAPGWRPSQGSMTRCHDASDRESGVSMSTTLDSCRVASSAAASASAASAAYRLSAASSISNASAARLRLRATFARLRAWRLAACSSWNPTASCRFSSMRLLALSKTIILAKSLGSYRAVTSRCLSGKPATDCIDSDQYLLPYRVTAPLVLWARNVLAVYWQDSSNALLTCKRLYGIVASASIGVYSGGSSCKFRDSAGTHRTRII